MKKYKVRVFGEKDCMDKVFDTKPEALKHLVSVHTKGTPIFKFDDGGHTVWCVKK